MEENTIVQENNRTKYHKRTAIKDHMSLVAEPRPMYSGHVTNF